MRLIYILATTIFLWAQSHADSSNCTKNNIKECMKEAKKSYENEQFLHAIDSLIPLCNANNKPACGLIGIIYRDGMGNVKKNTTLALHYMQEACEGGYEKSCRDAGILYQSLKQDENAIKIYEEGCQKDDIGACYNLATMYYFGDGVPQELNKAKVLYKKVCKMGDRKKACQRYERLSSLREINESEKWVVKCKEEDGIACHNLSTIYYNKGDFKKALELDISACVFGYTMGCKNAALSYFEGDHIKSDINKSIELFELAGCQGDGSSFFNIGNIYEFGKGIPKNLKKANNAYISGCAKEDMPSCVKVGLFFEKGVIGEPDGEKSKSFYKTACDQKEAKGCANMGFLYHKGKVIEKDCLRAKIYFEKACSLGDTQSCTHSKSIKIIQE